MTEITNRTYIHHVYIHKKAWILHINTILQLLFSPAKRGSKFIMWVTDKHLNQLLKSIYQNLCTISIGTSASSSIVFTHEYLIEQDHAGVLTAVIKIPSL